MRPDAIPIRLARSHATLPPEAVAALFGAGYALRGTERVEVVVNGEVRLSVEARPGAALALFLDAVDREMLGTNTRLQLRGPQGTRSAPDPRPLLPSLLLPNGLLRAWSLAEGQRVALAVGRVVLLDVPVAKGERAEAVVDRAVARAGGGASTARWLPGLNVNGPPSSPAARTVADGPLTVEGRVVTENDVRQARLLKKKLRLRPGQIVTPAARDLGRALGLLEE
ncbi:MAG TPA: hypothetical protein VD962_10165 [Rubricoccaceae bacterium]|nr:hypothetical protein [Rubricoccaceae bacterium]